MNLPIAEQYGLRLSRDYKVKSSCVQHTGDVNDVNKKHCWSVAKKEKAPSIIDYTQIVSNNVCNSFYFLSTTFRTSRGTLCNFTETFPACKLVGVTGVSFNVNFCVDTEVTLQFFPDQLELNNEIFPGPVREGLKKLFCVWLLDHYKEFLSTRSSLFLLNLPYTANCAADCAGVDPNSIIGKEK